MSKKRNKEGLIINKRYLSLIVGLFVLMLMSGSAFGFVDGYDYRRPIQINTTEDLTNYQVFLNITNTTNMLSDRADILFTYADDTNISFWIEDNLNSNYFTVWVNYSGTTANETIYLNYGNQTTVTTQSNIDNTMIFGDDFPGSSINGTKWGDWVSWAGGTGTRVVSNSQLILTGLQTSKGIGFPSATELPVASYTVKTKIDNMNDGGWNYGQARIQTVDPTFAESSIINGLFWSAYAPDMAYAINTVDSSISYTFNDATTHIYEYDIASSGNMYIDDVSRINVSSSIPDIPDYLRLHVHGIATFTIDWIIVHQYILNKPTYYIGTEETSETNYPPTITLTTPTNTTYYTTTINLTVQANDTDSVSFSCNVTDDGSLITTLTDDSTYSVNLTKTGGNHNITVLCEDSDSANSTETVYYYVFMGLNISTYYSDSGNLSDNWDIYITNGTDNYSNLSNNGTVLFEWDTIPTGNINITVNETNSTLFYMNATTNTTVNNSLFIPLNITMTAKIDNPIILTSSLGLSLLEGQITTVSCSSPEGSQTVSINDVYVVNPYILTVGTGLYDLLCQVPETLTYKPTNESEQISVNALFSCTTSNTYAFEKNITTTGNITTLNFTDAVFQNILKSDLSDVNVSGVIDTWVNTTGGYYIIVNNAGLTELNVRFGNYYVNNSYSTHNRATPIYDITGYTQTNPYQIYNLLDELTGEFISPPNSSIMVITSCNQGDTYITIAENDTKFLIATTQYINKTAVRVTYTADAYYSRQLYPSVSDALILKFYLADAFVNAIDRIDFVIQDQNYYYSKFQVYKTLDSEFVIITEGYFDNSRQFSTYLQEDIDYYLRANADGSLTDFGRITVVAPDTKYLGLITMKTSPDVSLMADHITSNFYTGDNYTKLYIYYNDDLSETINATITTYFENGTVFKTYYSAGIDTINIEYNISSYPTTSFYVTFNVWHETFGNSPLKWSQNTFFPALLDLGISSFWYGLIGLALLMIVALIVSSESVIGGSLLFIIMILVLNGMSWINIPFGVISLIIFLLLLGVMKDVNRGRS